MSQVIVLWRKQPAKQSVDLIKYNNPMISLSENECVYPQKTKCVHWTMRDMRFWNSGFWGIFEETQAGNNHNHPVPLWDISQRHEYDPQATEQFAKMTHLVRWFIHSRWWFSIALLSYQRVIPISIIALYIHPHYIPSESIKVPFVFH